MAQITGGLVSVEDSKPHSNDEDGRKKVRVDLSFAVGEGEDYTTTFDLASEAATNRVTALLNGVSLRAVGGTTAETPASPPAPAARRTRRTAAQIEADNAAKAAGHSPSGSAGGEQTSDDPASISLPDETAGDDDTFDIEAEAPVAEESFDIEPDAGGDPITDADLNSAVQKKNAEIKNPNAIRALIGAYNPDPKAAFQLRQIPADKRAEFVTKLAALEPEKKSA